MDRGLFGAVLGVALLQGLARLAALRVVQERPRPAPSSLPGGGDPAAPGDGT